MKQIHVAAGALLLGTSALAWAADKEAVNPVGESLAGKTAMSLDAKKPGLVDKDADAKWASSSAKDGSIAVASSAEAMDKPVLGEPGAAKFATADHLTWSDGPAQAKLAMADAKADPTAARTQPGMGGPIESTAAMTASLAPRPAAQNYPPCEPGRGDDNCIQLYEPGVRAQLASWNAPTGGLADGSATTAMGGPYEPVAGHADASATGTMGGDVAMNADRSADPVSGPTSDSALVATEADIDADYQGVGGPVVSQSGYPPCEPGPGDDRCIQLYERGVTGAGN